MLLLLKHVNEKPLNEDNSKTLLWHRSKSLIAFISIHFHISLAYSPPQSILEFCGHFSIPSAFFFFKLLVHVNLLLFRTGSIFKKYWNPMTPVE